MGSLSAIPGYDALESQRTALKAQIDTLLDQRDAAAEAFGGIASPQAQKYQQQVKALEPQYLSVIDQQQQLILNDGNGDQPSPTVTTGQSQSTPAANSRDDAYTQNSTSGGVGAGTTGNAATSIKPEDNPGTSTSTQQIISQTFGNGTQNTTIIAQPNVLDQYASYTYSISWYLLSPTQYNTVVLSQPFNTTGWSLLMQSGGAPITGRNQFFPVDYYMDDLEIESNVPLGGTGLTNAATNFKWKVVEPNGITLIPNLYNAVNALYKNTTPAAGEPGSDQAGPPASLASPTVNANQTPTTPNYLTAQHCFVIQFYGYDANGKLVAPATGQYTTTGSVGGPAPQAVITKYYPFVLQNITYRVAKSQVEYICTALPAPHMYNTSSDRGTIPFDFALTGQTVGQLLSGSPKAATSGAAAAAASGKDGRKSSSTPGIQPGIFATPIQAGGGLNQDNADALNLLAAGNMGA
jgi:hypothetical protein